MSVRSGRFRRIWLSPIALALLTIFGLMSALLGDGVWDSIGALSLGALPVICTAAWWRTRQRDRR